MSSGVEISVIIPSIHPEFWENLLDGIDKSLTIGEHKYSHEVIFVGPYQPTIDLPENAYFIESWRCPSACLQEGADDAIGSKICWLPDDIRIESEALGRCIKLLQHRDKKDGVILRYNEGEGYTGNQSDLMQYWLAGFHDGLKFKHVNPNWGISPVFMYNTDYFKDLGGLDCRMEHVNMNCHDFAFRLQQDGGNLYLSPSKVFSADWDPSPARIIQAAYDQNDLPLFKSIWDADILNRDIAIDFYNYLDTPKKWARRFK
jgi:hypothetical protein